MSNKSRRADRVKACELAAHVMNGRPDDSVAPLVWSLTVFFEEYIVKGTNGTAKKFGPKKPVKLKVASSK